MKVYELIKLLKAQNQNAEVILDVAQYEYLNSDILVSAPEDSESDDKVFISGNYSE